MPIQQRFRLVPLQLLGIFRITLEVPLSKEVPADHRQIVEVRGEPGSLKIRVAVRENERDAGAPPISQTCYQKDEILVLHSRLEEAFRAWAGHLRAGPVSEAARISAAPRDPPASKSMETNPASIRRIL